MSSLAEARPFWAAFLAPLQGQTLVDDGSSGMRACSLICDRIRSDREQGNTSVRVSMGANEQIFALNGITCTYSPVNVRPECELPVNLSKEGSRMLGTILRDGLFGDFSVSPITVTSDNVATVYELDNVRCSFKNANDSVTCLIGVLR